MQTEHLILVDTFCTSHNVEYSFIRSLHENGLIEITTREEQTFIPESNLEFAEKLIRLHNDLEINLEGVEVITYLLDQLKQQQHEITGLKNRLRFYET
jgi:chaperone modulatory protein CbpM